MERRQWQNGIFNPVFGPAAGTVDLPKPWPTPEQQRQEFGWTRRVPRPVAGDCPEYLLADRQQTWDEAERTRRETEAHWAARRAEREAAERARREEAEHAFVAHQAAAATAREAELRAIYFSQGGAPETWEAEKAAILRRDREERTLSGPSAIRSLITRREMLG